VNTKSYERSVSSSSLDSDCD